MSARQTSDRTAAPPKVTRLALTAIKGFRLDHPPSVALTAGGAVGNRDFLVVDADEKLLSVTRSGAFLPYWSRFDPEQGVLSIGRGDQTVLAEPVRPRGTIHAHLFGERYVDGHLLAGPWDEALSDLAGEPVRLVQTATPAAGYDVHPVTLTSEASVAALGSERDGSPLDDRRFRMLITFDGAEAFAEDGWAGTAVAAGTSVLQIGGPVSRCAAVQRHPDDPARSVNALRLINAVRGVQPSEFGRTLNLGVYAHVLTPGLVSVGDRLDLGQPE